MIAHVRIDLQRGHKVETFSLARVQPIGNGAQLSQSIAGQVCPLGQVLTQQRVGILVGPALPRAHADRQKDLDRKPLGQARVLHHFFAP